MKITNLMMSLIIERYKYHIEQLLALIEHSDCDFKNGVTDSTGSIDEGDVIAGRILGEAKQAISDTCLHHFGWWAEVKETAEEDIISSYPPYHHYDVYTFCAVEGLKRHANFTTEMDEKWVYCKGCNKSLHDVKLERKKKNAS